MSTTRMHRSEVRHQINRLRLAGGPAVPAAALERAIAQQLGYPLAEADHAELRGIFAALAAVASAVDEEKTR